jgi:hypothetical protein
VERQAELAGRIVGADGAAAKRWVADDEVVSLGDARLGEVLGANARVRMEELRDPSRDRVHFDAGQRRLLGKRFGQEGEEEAGPASGLEQATAGEAHATQGAPDPATDEFRREMRILRHTGEACEFARRDELLQVLPEGAPALREGVLGGSAKDIVRKVARAEGREEREAFLSSAVAFRASSSISSINRMAAMLSAARVFQSGARRRAAVRRKLRATTGAGPSSSVSATASSPGSPKARRE